jgi:hypothetical protein
MKFLVTTLSAKLIIGDRADETKVYLAIRIAKMGDKLNYLLTNL